MKNILSLLLGVALLSSAGSAWAELKLGYIDSQILRDKLPEFKEAQRTLDRLRQQYDREALERESQLGKLEEDFRKQELLMSEARKQELSKLFEDKMQQHQKLTEKIYGPNGDLMKKNSELSQPIFDSINRVLKTFGEEEGFDFIFDVSSNSAVIYAQDKYDLTEKLIERLDQERKAAEKGKR